jgi:DNA polymerase-3 subunit gamma/tau
VREILGLVADESYTELLVLLAGRNAAGVFGLIDRLEDAGADLVEFMAGAGEILRSLLMLQLGAQPDGLTESVRGALEAQRDALAPGDLVRMLKLLGESEASLRRSGNTRLAVETLLLRWALMDRTVDIAAALLGGGDGSSSGGAPRRSEGNEGAGRLGGSAPAPAPRPGAPTVSRFADVKAQVEATTPPNRVAPESPSRLAAEPVAIAEWSLEGLLAAWPDIARAAREQSRFLGEALASARPVSVNGPAVTLALPTGNDIHVEALTRQKEAVETLLAQSSGHAIRLSLAEASGSAAPTPPPRRLSEGQARAERLKVLKGRDPALEAAAESLDLEVLE